MTRRSSWGKGGFRLAQRKAGPTPGKGLASSGARYGPAFLSFAFQILKATAIYNESVRRIQHHRARLESSQLPGLDMRSIESNWLPAPQRYSSTLLSLNSEETNSQWKLETITNRSREHRGEASA